MSVLPAPRRFVTSHNAKGQSIIQFEGEVPQTEVLEKSGRKARFAVPWRTNGFPSDISPSDTDAITEGGPLHNDNGTLIRVVDMPPQTSSPVHRTVSLDYGTGHIRPHAKHLSVGIMISGELYLELDDGSERKLGPGDVVVQRGTLHAWNNRTDEWARIVFVLVAAEAPTINGKKLENEMHKA